MIIIKILITAEVIDPNTSENIPKLWIAKKYATKSDTIWVVIEFRAIKSNLILRVRSAICCAERPLKKTTARTRSTLKFIVTIISSIIILTVGLIKYFIRKKIKQGIINQ